MIKGVNRQMIEVTHTGSPYFERAFLVVRGDGSPTSEEGLHRLAEKVVRQAETYAGLRQQRWRRRVERWLTCLGSAAAGAGLLWLLQQILG
ncbi:MAG: hypothetical protein IIW40_00330 [Clostridia bacterium]|nr:hypothetical protein [Clostridia bacterium]